MLEIGDTLTFSSKLYDKDPTVDPTAVLINPVSATLTITDPNDVVTTPSITVPPAVTGTFEYKLNAALSGRYRGRWLFTLANGSTSAYTEGFEVQPSDPGFLVSLSEAKIHLNIPASKTSSDEEIRSWLAAVTPIVEDIAGICIPKTYTEVVSGSDRLVLNNTPVLTLVSIIPYFYGTTYMGETLAKSTPVGEVRLINGGNFYGGTFTVTYTAGRKPIPANISQAAKIILKHLWETQRGVAGTPFQGDDETAIDSGWGYAIPNRALQLLKPSRLGPSVG